MADPKPIYEGVIGDDGHTRMCKCDELASFEVTTEFQHKEQTFDVCTEHFRFFSRRTQQVKSFTQFPEHASFQVRMRVWVKRNV